MDITRKRFIELFSSGSALLILHGCGGGDDYDGNPAPAPAPAPASGCNDVVSANHGHTLVVPVADLDSTTARTYSIMGQATHDHQVTFTPAQLQQLKAGTAVTVASTAFSGDGHNHAVTLTCVVV
jgi:VCBS repeat-containing protein